MAIEIMITALVAIAILISFILHRGIETQARNPKRLTLHTCTKGGINTNTSFSWNFYLQNNLVYYGIDKLYRYAYKFIRNLKHRE